MTPSAIAHIQEALSRCLQETGIDSFIDDAHAKSSIGWSGGLQTTWAPNVRPDVRDAHYAQIEERLRQRARSVRILCTAVSISAAIANPLAAPAALQSLSELLTPKP